MTKFNSTTVRSVLDTLATRLETELDTQAPERSYEVEVKNSRSLMVNALNEEGDPEPLGEILVDEYGIPTGTYLKGDTDLIPASSVQQAAANLLA